MKNKKNWYLMLIRHFYGIRGEIDEYQVQEINRIGNNAFLLVSIIWPILIVMNSFLVFLTSTKVALMILIGLSLLTLIGAYQYVASAVSKLHLTDIDSYDEKDYRTWLKKTKYKAILDTLTFFFVSRIFTILFNTVTGESFWGNVFSIKNNLVALIASIFFGVFSYYSMKQKVKKP